MSSPRIDLWELKVRKRFFFEKKQKTFARGSGAYGAAYSNG
jgi:hypothetical protein